LWDARLSLLTVPDSFCLCHSCSAMTPHDSNRAAVNYGQLCRSPDAPSPHCVNGYVTAEGSSRREFIQQAVVRTIGGFVTAAGVQFSNAPLVLGQTKLTPDAALRELMDGNRRFTTNRLTAHDSDLAILKRSTIEKQEPFAAVLSCADSRVPVELIFDQSIGRIFVTRIAGNVVTSEIIASLEYGAAVLGTKVILVMGHSNCGAVKATIQGKGVPGQISALYPHIRPAVDQAGPNLEAATKANAKIQAALLRQASTVICDLVKESKLKVVAGYYDLASGSAALLD
jgi:carbonic anhydrase